MASCPICGSRVTSEDKVCSNCGFTMQDESPNPKGSEDGINKNNEIQNGSSDDITDGQAESEEDTRKKWLEQQRSLKDELTGIKSSMAEEKAKAEEQNRIPIPPYPLAYPIKPDLGMLSRNYGPMNMTPQNVLPVDHSPYTKPAGPDSKDDLENEEQVPDELKTPSQKDTGGNIPVAVAVKEKEKETIQDDSSSTANSESTENDPEISTELKKPVSMELKVAMATPIKKPPKVKVKSKDLIEVDAIMDDVEDIKPRQNTEIAGAIDKILSHEKSVKTGDGPKQPSAQEKTPASMKRYQINDILKYLTKSLRKTSDRFNRKPIENLIEKAQKKLDMNNIEAAYSIAINAKKTFNRSIKHYENARKRLKQLREKHPEILSKSNPQNDKYEQVVAEMKNGQYFRVAQFIDDIEESLGPKPGAVATSVSSDRDLSNIPVAHKVKSSEGQIQGKEPVDVGNKNEIDRRSSQSRDYARWKKKKSRKKGRK